ncbi:MAG: large conductance mechanosensitive channel protein MscL [Candidatus Andeanibacterium colombiense]|uniref:Large-conductance mechanosensitive channel n=1 Tax=Candidatus Andeanibacterium colombiense TaxID=3121345 RepID=A0AAJ5X9L6_9SPHN|nr:MAG: large conductance mechanosensitive channel protein MscL [Sphingomonadaceae bacterium]
MLKEFKAFIAQGNVLDLAVGVIIGAAFGTIVKSLTDSIIMPVVGLFVGSVDFSSKYLVLSGTVAPGTPLAEAQKAGANVLAYGAFVSAVINFLILAFIIFLMVKAANKVLHRHKEEAAPSGPSEIDLLTEIRDALKK